jgi:hypothetical protein
MQNLTNLTSFRADGNPMVSPPQAIMELPAEKIIRYLKSKLMLTGESIHSMFVAFDRDKSGSVTRSELLSGLHLIDLSHRCGQRSHVQHASAASRCT